MDCLKKIATVMLCLCLIHFSCRNKQNTEKARSLEIIIAENLGKKLILPDCLRTYKPFSSYVADSIEIFNSPYKIYSHVNASCGTCIGNIDLWNNFIPELSKNKIPVILICKSDDEFELFQYLCEAAQIKEFPYPFILDMNSQFLKLNKFMSEVYDFETVLTDVNNTILLIGNPVINNKIKELYVKTIMSK